MGRNKNTICVSSTFDLPPIILTRFEEAGGNSITNRSIRSFDWLAVLIYDFHRYCPL